MISLMSCQKIRVSSCCVFISPLGLSLRLMKNDWIRSIHHRVMQYFRALLPLHTRSVAFFFSFSISNLTFSFFISLIPVLTICHWYMAICLYDGFSNSKYHLSEVIMMSINALHKNYCPAVRSSRRRPARCRMDKSQSSHFDVVTFAVSPDLYFISISKSTIPAMTYVNRTTWRKSFEAP